VGLLLPLEKAGARAHLLPWGRPVFLQERLCLGAMEEAHCTSVLGPVKAESSLVLGSPAHLPRVMLGEILLDHWCVHFLFVQNQKLQGIGSKGIPEDIVPTRNSAFPVL
jgi:hypothetical protein